jgi:GrpB-like predicted nucleotidyltransferase (UPF0157 family)
LPENQYHGTHVILQMTIPPQDAIIMVEHDPNWPLQFEEERGRLERAFGREAVCLEHVGSTAVPELCAKPVIDILVSVHRLHPADHYEPFLSDLGYRNVPHDDDAERLFWMKGMPRTHHLHIVPHGTWSHWKHILFRDYLRSHHGEMERYANLKRESAGRFRNDRQAYLESKGAMIDEMSSAAVREMLVQLRE